MSDDQPENLSSSFDKILDIQQQLKNCNISSNEPEFQEKVKDAIGELEQLTKNINSLELFSLNESIEELSTNNLKFLLIPAILADFTMKIHQSDRVKVLEKAEVYYYDFLSRLKSYQLCSIDLEMKKDNHNLETNANKNRTEIDSLIQSANDRKSKIDRYMKTKTLEKEIEKLKVMLKGQQKKTLNVDDEIERDFYLKLIDLWKEKTLDELDSIQQELPMARMHAAMGKLSSTQDRPSKPSKSTFNPMIITKNDLQKQVYGAGYPSIPTVSIEEFVKQKMDEGSLQTNSKSNSLYDWAMNPLKKNQEEEEEIVRKEKLIEKDDPEELDRLRKQDEWKDEHKYGEGNRYNMG
ncbi:Rho GTPase-activating protein [Sarcoptes scabiei]|nr:Rho GTPase-activating protein [Sarcoptes scabiei]